MTTDAKTSAFEHTSCHRCSGTGYVRGFSHVLGGVCFRCGGAGYRFTKRGAAAQTMFADSLKVAAVDVEIGRMIRVTGFSCGPISEPTRWYTIETSVTVDGETTLAGTNPRVEGLFRTTQPAASLVRVNWTAEQKRAKLEAALAYQATLTQAGTVRKGAAA